MSHSFSLISTLAIGFAIAWALGFLMERIKVPALVGYLLAGILVSPSVFGFDVAIHIQILIQIHHFQLMALCEYAGMRIGSMKARFWRKRHPINV